MKFGTVSTGRYTGADRYTGVAVGRRSTVDDLCARLRPPSERSLSNASPQVTHVSGKVDDSCARLRPPSEKPLSNASPQVTHVSGITDALCARPTPPGRRR